MYVFKTGKRKKNMWKSDKIEKITFKKSKYFKKNPFLREGGGVEVGDI